VVVHAAAGLDQRGGEGGRDGSNGAGLELLIDRMRTFKSNDEFLAEIAKAPSA